MKTFGPENLNLNLFFWPTVKKTKKKKMMSVGLTLVLLTAIVIRIAVVVGALFVDYIIEDHNMHVGIYSISTMPTFTKWDFAHFLLSDKWLRVWKIPCFFSFVSIHNEIPDSNIRPAFWNHKSIYIKFFLYLCYLDVVYVCIYLKIISIYLCVVCVCAYYSISCDLIHIIHTNLLYLLSILIHNTDIIHPNTKEKIPYSLKRNIR